MPLTQTAAARKDARNAKSEMQHRHFATVAAILANAPDFTKHNSGNPIGAHRQLCRYFADELAETNPRFDRDRFLKACGAQDRA